MSAADDYEIGVTGARFGPAPRRRRRERERVRSERGGPPTMERQAFPGEPGDVEQTAALPAYPAARPEPASAEQPSGARPGATAEPPDPGADGLGEPPGAAPAGGLSRGGSRVRPYFYTKGRTRSRYELAIETLVSTAPAALGRPELAEHREVLELCRQPHSVAEVGALLGMPLGVARVLVGDLAGSGGLVVHRSVATANGPDLGLMERVLSGLRRL